MAKVAHLSKGAERKFFAEKKKSPLPDLIEVQKRSYRWFTEEGLKELFEDISPIKPFSGDGFDLSFLDFYLDEAKFDEKTSRSKNLTYEAPLRVQVKLLNKKTNKAVKQEVYLGDFPLMTDRGTFIINGIERCVVSQIIRSEGVFFFAENYGPRRYYGAKVIPNRGAWLEIETDLNNVIWVKIDRKRKVAVTSLLRAFGIATDKELKETFADVNTHPDIDYIQNTIDKDAASNLDEGLMEIYKRIRPGDFATPDNAKSLIYAMFFRFDRYDLGRVGRYKLNERFGDDMEITKENRVLRLEDVVGVVKEIIRLNITQEDKDDIDHLGNRRMRAIGELIQNKFRIGLSRMERIAKDRMSTLDAESMTPGKLINARPVIATVKEFFMSSPLSQFMEQTNPLSELEHKRRISAMGPGGLSRERAGFDVRDVHPTHYGRICPIATPEGPSIGLVGHLASYAAINEYGFLETPYYMVERTFAETVKHKDEVLVKKGETLTPEQIWRIQRRTGVDLRKNDFESKVTNKMIYLNAVAEGRYNTTPATTKVDKNGHFVDERAPMRVVGEPREDVVSKIDFQDVASNQIVSIATSLIPFMEHDDGQRALMGTNMQRQAVPTLLPQSPIVGTGIEKKVALDSGYIIVAEEDGVIKEMDGKHVVVKGNSGKSYTYELTKYRGTNAATCVTQKPIVDLGQEVKKGDVLVDGPGIENGELALGQNVLVAFLSWEGYNYEDAIVISDRLIKDDVYSSIYIDTYTIEVRDTKLGPELITSDIPNISEERLKNLDENGIVRIGAEVSSGDILVGKITPKGETELSAEEKLLQAIFGDKAKDVRDSSLYLEHGEHGKVIDVRIFTQENGDKLLPGVLRMVQVTVANLRKIEVGDKLAGRHGNKGVIAKVVAQEDMPFLEDGTPVDMVLSPLGVASRMNLGQILETHLGLAAKTLGYKVATPVLDGVSEETIKEELKKAGYAEDGKVVLIDGKTGKAFDHRVTIGWKYMLKLNHMVEDKIHQRSIGPYSLITQQPLGGRAQSGGQRFGEMEVWALEAYGAAHTLQEILTIKSDDVTGRSKAYEAIIKNERIQRTNLPEAFNVLMREMRGLCMDVQMLTEEELDSHDSLLAEMK